MLNINDTILMKKILIIVFIFIIGMHVSSQPWMHPPYLKINTQAKSTKTPGFYEIQKAFRLYEKEQDSLIKVNAVKTSEDDDDEGKFPGYSQFKRWEAYMEPRVYPSGDISISSNRYKEFQNYLNSPYYNKSKSAKSSGSWSPLGPTGTVTTGEWGGAGRVNFIRLDPNNSNIMWTGSPSGGLWKSTDDGMNWTTNTDQLSLLGCSDIAINPENTKIMYLATGDADGHGSQLWTASIGVLKSTDGGLSWGNNTINWQVSWSRNIYKLLINPKRPDTVYAATSAGIYRTLNAGAKWDVVQAGQFSDIEFKPGNPNVIYATAGDKSGGTFYKSTDAGKTFVVVSSGLPLSTDVARMAVAVTPADSNYVYVVVVNKTTYDFYGFYRSVDGGDNFTLRANTPNILSGSPYSQAWYNLAIAVSPIHKDTVIVGATVCWKTTDGGLTWVKHTAEIAGLVPFVHPDHHALVYLPGKDDSSYLSGNDGGVWKTTDYGKTWNPINDGLQITQIYKLGTSRINPNTIMTGNQDMASQLYRNGKWSLFTPNTGDGMENIFEHDNDTIIYLESYQGRIIVTYNSHPLYNIVCKTTGNGVNAGGNWLTPFVMNPVYDTVLLVGKAQVWRTIDGGKSFKQVGDISGGTGNVYALSYAPSNPDYIYAAKYKHFYTAKDGNTFVDRTGTLPVASAYITAIAVSNTDPNKVWVTFSGYSAGNKVWYSSDAGLNWTNYSTGLPNLPVNCIVYQNDTDDAIYVGTDSGVYFIDNKSLLWQPYFTGLPNVDVEELEIANSIGKIRAATSGRGLWESDLAVTSNNSKYSISGVVTYDNSIASILNKVTIRLYNADGLKIDSTTTSAIGSYIFSNKPNGTYRITAVSSATWGGSDPIDALLTLRYFIGSYNFTDNIKTKAADVSIDNKINPLDALMINQRYVLLIDKFKAGDWLFGDGMDIIIINSNVTIDLKGICFGDVNGSFKP